MYSGSGGTLSFHLNLGASGTLPNLVPFIPSGWSDKIVVSRSTGTNSDDALMPGETAYVDWAVLNDSAVATPAGVYLDLLVDGVRVAQWLSNSSLDPSHYFFIEDQPIGPLTAGTHTIRIVGLGTHAHPQISLDALLVLR